MQPLDFRGHGDFARTRAFIAGWIRSDRPHAMSINAQYWIDRVVGECPGPIAVVDGRVRLAANHDLDNCIGIVDGTGQFRCRVERNQIVNSDDRGIDIDDVLEGLLGDAAIEIANRDRDIVRSTLAVLVIQIEVAGFEFEWQLHAVSKINDARQFAQFVVHARIRNIA